jgi:multidrug efflux pump subunit AcrA (membrane-fusion protein)
MAAKTVRLQAPFSATVTAQEDLFVGRQVNPSEVIYQLDTIKLDLALDNLQVELAELKIKEERLLTESRILDSRIETARRLVQNGVDGVSKEKELLEIQNRLYSNNAQLFKDETVSLTEYLRAETNLRQAELRLINQELTLNNRNDALDQLLLAKDVNERERQNIENEEAALKIRIKELRDDVRRASLFVDFPAQIVSLGVQRSQEVVAGAPLATLRSIDRTQLEVNVPDSYFRWLYAGSFLDQLADPDIDSGLITIELVLEDYALSFPGAYLKAISASVNVPTRSLPILIERKNPLDDQGRPLPKQELKPGMYCRVILNLANLENSFLVPTEVIREDQSLLVAQEGDTGWTLELIQGVEVLFEGESGSIVRLPSDLESIHLVTDSLRAIQEGQAIEPVFIEHEEAP